MDSIAAKGGWAAAKWAGNRVAKDKLGKDMDKYKNKKVGGSDVSLFSAHLLPLLASDHHAKQDPFFEQITLPNGKKGKVKKQIPDFIPAHDALVLAKAKSRAYHLDICLFNVLGIRFGWSAIYGLIPE